MVKNDTCLGGASKQNARKCALKRCTNVPNVYNRPWQHLPITLHILVSIHSTLLLIFEWCKSLIKGTKVNQYNFKGKWEKNLTI